MAWVKARVFIPEVCDRAVPGNCAPTVEVEGADEVQGLTEEHGIAFQEPTQELAEKYGVALEDGRYGDADALEEEVMSRANDFIDRRGLVCDLPADPDEPVTRRQVECLVDQAMADILLGESREEG